MSSAAGKRTGGKGKKKASSKPEVEEQLAEMQKQLDDEKAKNAKLIDLTTESLGKMGKKKPSGALTNAMQRAVRKVIRHNLWREYKFLPNEQREVEFTKMVLRGLDLPKMNKAKKKAWVQKHLSGVCSVLNTHRGYVVSILKGSAFKWYTNHKKTLPTTKEILACATRDVDLNKPKDRELFDFYWNEYLSHVAGNDHDWKPDKRHYAIISEAAPLGKPDQHYMTASNEAFAALVYENYRDAWLKQFKLKEQNGNAQLILAKNIRGGANNNAPTANNGNNNGTKEKGWEMFENKIYCYAQEYKGLWTQTDVGSKRAGGWKFEGVQRYIALETMIEAVRVKPECLEVEREFLGLLRQDLGITEDTFEQTQARKKRKRTDDDEEVEVELPDTWANKTGYETSDDEDDEEEADENTGQNAQNVTGV